MRVSPSFGGQCWSRAPGCTKSVPSPRSAMQVVPQGNAACTIVGVPAHVRVLLPAVAEDHQVHARPENSTQCGNDSDVLVAMVPMCC